MNSIQKWEVPSSFQNSEWAKLGYEKLHAIVESANSDDSYPAFCEDYPCDSSEEDL